MNYKSESVVYVTEAGYIPAVTLAHYDSEQNEHGLSVANSSYVDIITTGYQPTRFNMVSVSSESFDYASLGSHPVGVVFKADVDPAGDPETNLYLTGAASTGVMRDGSFGWKDLIGAVQPKTTGANTPVLGELRGGNVRTFFFQNNDKIDFVYHIPHDWVVGTDLYIHVHWGHNGTNISGSFVFDFYTTFARGFNQASNGDFIAEKNTTLTVDSLNITNTPQYRHRTDEIQLSSSSPTASQVDTDIIEVDGLLIINGVMTTIPTITGSASYNFPSIFTIDIHYQSASAGTTVNKAPNFYG